MAGVRLHPALSQLFVVQARGRFQRWCARFRSPRRLLLSVIALLLAVVWLGNAVFSIMARDPYAEITLRHWIPFGLMAYTFWHLLKVSWTQPEEAIEWSPAEREAICGGPFTRGELLKYRLTVVMTATLFKATFTSLLLLPDLPSWLVGCLGLALALSFLELWRMFLEMVTYGISARAYRWFRTVVFAVAGTVGLYALIVAINVPPTSGVSALGSSTHLPLQFLHALSDLRTTALGRLCETPFVAFTEVILSPRLLILETLGWLAVVSLFVGTMAWLVSRVDRWSHAAVIGRERANYDPTASTIDANTDAATVASARLTRIVRFGGAGPLAWRQWIGAFQHRVGLVAAISVPAVLALMPLTQPPGLISTFLQVVGGLVFYSFLLLPAALKFDFRRDYDRLMTLKMLPLPAVTVVIGQLAVPVLLTSLYQLVVLAVVTAFHPESIGAAIAAACLLVPVNVLIFATENLMFLLYPYRLKQEGIDVFLRTILVFTAKGVLFAIALAVFFVWSQLVGGLSLGLNERLGIFVDHRLLFVIGISLAMIAAAGVFVRLLVHAFQRYDPSLDAVS